MGFPHRSLRISGVLLLTLFTGCPAQNADLTGAGNTADQTESGTNSSTLPQLGSTTTTGPDSGTVANNGNGGDDGGIIVAPPRFLQCNNSQAAVLSAGQTVSLNFSSSASAGGDPLPLTFTVTSTDSSLTGTALGTVATSTGYYAVYTAPSTVAESFDVEISAADGQAGITSTPCTIKLLQDGDLGISDDGTTEGVVGNVYHIPEGTSQLINPKTLTAVTTLLTPNINVPDHDWEEGFPGLDSSFNEWFEIDFKAQIYIPADGDYQFRADSDDGSILFINSQQVVNDDGVHAVTTVIGPVVHYSTGWYSFEEWYYQGPRVRIANMLYWRTVTNQTDYGDWAIIPPEALARPQ